MTEAEASPASAVPAASSESGADAAGFEVRWIRVVAIAAFMAGLIVGVAAPALFRVVSGNPESSAIDPDSSYVMELSREYELDAAQEATLRMILLDARNESTRILRQIIQGDPGKLPPQLLTVRNRADERIQVVLSESQRERFNRDKR